MSPYKWLNCALVAGFCLASISLVHGQSTQPKKKDKKEHKVAPPHVPTPITPSLPPSVTPRPAPVNPPARTPVNPPPLTGPRLTFPPVPTTPPAATTPPVSTTQPQTLPVTTVGGGPYTGTPFGNANYGSGFGGYPPGFNGGMIVSPGLTQYNPFASANPWNAGTPYVIGGYPPGFNGGMIVSPGFASSFIGGYPPGFGFGFSSGMFVSAGYMPFDPYANFNINPLPPYSSYGMMDSSNYWGPQRNRKNNSLGQNPFSMYASPGFNPYASQAYGPYGMNPASASPFGYSYPMSYNPMMSNYNPYMSQPAYMGPYPMNNVPVGNFAPNWQMPMDGMNGMGQPVNPANGNAAGMPRMMPIGGNAANQLPQFGGNAPLFNPAAPVLDPAALKDQ